MHTFTPDAPPRSHHALPDLPALDGLRALAVLGVLLFHDGRLVGGYLGVDLFFVLSGFLITSLLVGEWRAAGRIDLRAFWIRRARRLFPALALVLLAVIAYAALGAAATELPRIESDGLATLGYVANWHAILAGDDYWTLFGGAHSPLQHAWSLSIEEQFYLVWPLVTVAVLRLGRGSRRALFVVSLLLAVLSALAMLLLYAPESSARAYMGTDTRATAILLGAALATIRAKLGWIRGLDALGLLALAGLGVAWALLGGQDPFLYRGGFWLTQLGVVVLIACAAHPAQSRIARGLAWRPLVALGKISYGVYLWHWPIFVVLTPTRIGVDGALLTTLRFALTLAVALASYVLVERPIRTRGLRILSRRPGVGPPGTLEPGCPRIRGPWRIGAVVSAAVGAIVTGLVLATPATPTFEIPADQGGRVRVLFVGDSLSVALSDCVREIRSPTPLSIVGGQGGCNILSDQFPLDPKQGGGDCDTTWISISAAFRPHVTAIVLGGGFFAAAKIDGRWQRPCDAGWKREYRRELIREITEFQKTSDHVVLALVPYYEGTNLKHLTNKTRMDCFNQTLREIAHDVPGVTLLDFFTKVCPSGVCIQTSHGAPIRDDGLHFSRPGCHEVAAWALGRLLETVEISPTP